MFQLFLPLVYFCQCKSYLSIVENNLILRIKYLSSSKSINSRLKVLQSENGQICPLSWCSELFRSVMHRLMKRKFSKGKFQLIITKRIIVKRKWLGQNLYTLHNGHSWPIVKGHEINFNKLSLQKGHKPTR